jgi:ubiquinone/menaquinone biosynthesis C-methylase UbiE
MSQTEPANPSPARRAAFAGDARSRRLKGAAQAAFWTAAAAAGRAIVRPSFPTSATREPEGPEPAAPAAALTRGWGEAFEKDARDVAAGLYVVADPPLADPAVLLRRLEDLYRDGRRVEARRRKRAGGVEVRESEADLSAYPVYYRQNFHYQTDGWLSPESARRYETQVEALFAGSAGPMRRRGLALLAQALKGRDQRGLVIADVACGSGAFTADVAATFPRATLLAVDLSHAYLAEAVRRSPARPVQAPAEALPFADASVDAITCVYLFHELPPKVRAQVAAEFARVLKPGGVLVMVDSVQASDSPQFARSLRAFPVHFHEPFYESYQATDLPSLFAEAGLSLESTDAAFLTKALLLRR